MLANPCCKKSSLFFLLILFCVGERWQQEKSIWHGYSAWSYIIIIIILLNNFPPGINKVLWFWFWLCFCKCAKIIQLKKKYIYIFQSGENRFWVNNKNNNLPMESRHRWCVVMDAEIEDVMSVGVDSGIFNLPLWRTGGERGGGGSYHCLKW